jgi:flagellar biogenesis protein FliO
MRTDTKRIGRIVKDSRVVFGMRSERRSWPRRILAAVAWLQAACCFGAGAGTNLWSNSLTPSSLPETGPSLLRVLGALTLVLGLFLGGAWLVRSGRFSILGGSRSSRLNVLETRSLGARQALHVVAYGHERFLIGSTPSGINLLSHLAPPQDGDDSSAGQPANGTSFAQALTQVLSGQKTSTRKSEGAT